MSEGLKVTLEGLGGGLTVDEHGRKLLPKKLVFQCPPMEQFKVDRSFSMGNYDTIDQGQFTRKGSRQLKVWQYDTLVMDLGVSGGQTYPRWVPYPHFDSPGAPSRPAFYRDQLARLHDAGAPFRFTADLPGGFAPILALPAVLLAFSETHKMGEADAIYLEGVSFTEWRDPKQNQQGLGHGRPADAPPTTVRLMRDGVCVTGSGQTIPSQHSAQHQATLALLSKHFFHTPTDWREIARANGLHDGGQNTPLVKFKRYRGHIPVSGVAVRIPEIGPTREVSVPTDAVKGG